MATVPSTSSGDVTNTTTRLRGTAAHAQLSGVRDARSCSGSSPNDQQPDHVKDEDIDPFSYHPRLTKLSYTKVVINTLWLLPLRLIFIVIPSIVMGIIVCVLAVVCSDKYDKNNPRPLSKWGKLVTNTLGRAVARVFLFGFGFNWIHTRGELAPTTEAPILIVSPHSCFLDMFVMCMYRIPTFLSRADIIRVPLFGWVVSRTFRPIFVEREKQGSRNKAVSEIRRYASSNGDWPPVVIFPEGTTTNTKALIGFKQGAFLPKLPIQPVVIQYNRNKLNTTSWSGDGLGMLGSLYLTLCQFHNSLEVEFLPVYHPSDEEKNDSKVYARNVQQLMAKKVNVPATSHTFEDLLLMKTTRANQLPFRSGMVIYQKANRDLNMDFRAMKKWLHRFIAMDGDKDGFIRLGDFTKFLRVPDDACVKAVFASADKAGAGILNFRSYLYGVVGKAKVLIQDSHFITSMFNFFDSDGDGLVSVDDLSSHLPLTCFLSNYQSKSSDCSKQPPKDSSEEDEVPKHMNMEQFSSLISYHPEYALIFQECQQAEIIFNTLWLAPLRLIFIVLPSVLMGILVCLLAVLCDRYDKDNPRPLSRWGKLVTNYLGVAVDRFFLFGFGFNWIHTRGELASPKEAPILVVSPHSCILDMFIVSLYRVPTFLARADIKRIPLLGWLIARTFRTIFVEREEQGSRNKAVREIRKYASSKGEWPQVLIFPEGTTTNTKALIGFKQGAFLPKLPVQPVLIKYKNKLNTTTWSGDGLGVIGSLYLTMCQFHNSLEVEFLPVYHPSDEEIRDTKLYACNVQQLMAKKLNVPATSHTYEDLLLMKTTRRTQLPFHSGMVVYQKANRDLNMDFRAMKKWLHRFIAMDGDKDGFIRLGDFTKFLRVPDDARVKAVFASADKAGAGILNFRSYLYGVVGKARVLIQDSHFITSMFNFFDSDGDGLISLDDLSNHLPFTCFPSHQPKSSDHSKQPSQSNEKDTVPKHMNMEQFSSLISYHPEYALIFQECQHAEVSSPPPLTNGNSLSLRMKSMGRKDTFPAQNNRCLTHIPEEP